MGQGRLEGLRDQIEWCDAQWEDLKEWYGKNGKKILSREDSDAMRRALRFHAYKQEEDFKAWQKRNWEQRKDCGKL